MFRNRVDGPQLQSSGIAVKGTAENQKQRINSEKEGRRKDMGWREYKGGRDGKRRETKADL